MNEVGDVFKTLVKDIETCNALESGSTQKAKRESSPEFRINDVMSIVKSTVEHCNQARKRVHANTSIDISDTRLSKLAKFTDEMALKHFETFLQYVPRLVNVVTLAEAFPVPGSNLKLPLDLSYIASRCTGAYFAPKRFSAVQLAYTNPRARVLIFRTCPCQTQL